MFSYLLPRKKKNRLIEVLFKCYKRNIIYSKCILSTFYLINVGTFRRLLVTQTVSWIHYHSASAHYIRSCSQNNSVQMLPFLILPFLLRLFMSLDMKVIKRYWKIWCLRFEGQGLSEAPRQRVLKCCVYQTIWIPTKLHLCFNSLVTVLSFSFLSDPFMLLF